MEYMDEGSATMAKDALHNYKLDGENKIKVRVVGSVTVDCVSVVLTEVCRLHSRGSEVFPSVAVLYGHLVSRCMLLPAVSTFHCSIIAVLHVPSKYGIHSSRTQLHTTHNRESGILQSHDALRCEPVTPSSVLRNI